MKLKFQNGKPNTYKHFLELRQVFFIQIFYGDGNRHPFLIGAYLLWGCLQGDMGSSCLLRVNENLAPGKWATNTSIGPPKKNVLPGYGVKLSQSPLGQPEEGTVSSQNVILGSETSLPSGSASVRGTCGAQQHQMAVSSDGSQVGDLINSGNTSISSLKRKFGEIGESESNETPPPPPIPPAPPVSTTPSTRSSSHSTLNLNSSTFHSWPRFLIIHSTNPKVPKLTAISPFLFYKGIQGIAGEPKQLSPLASGDFLIEVDKETHSRNLLKTTSIGNIPIQITPHKTLNSCKGMVKCPALNPCTEDEIVENLQSQGVTSVRRLIIRKDNTEIKTSTYILEFSLPEPPEKLTVAYFKQPVTPYYPNPLRCYNCQIFGHHKSKCNRSPICGKCAQPAHEGDCTNPLLCVNCKGNHSSFFKQCRKWTIEKEIVAIRIKQKISFPEARRIVEARYISGSAGISCADVVRGGPQAKVSTSASVETQCCPEDFLCISDTNQTPAKPSSPKKTANPTS